MMTEEYKERYKKDVEGLRPFITNELNGLINKITEAKNLRDLWYCKKKIEAVWTCFEIWDSYDEEKKWWEGEGEGYMEGLGLGRDWKS